MPQSIHCRRGAVLAAALICLLLVMLFTGIVARSMVLRHRTARVDERQIQCFWLAESAVARATARCQRDPSYAGELWTIAIKNDVLPLNGLVEIKVEPVLDAPGKTRITVNARCLDQAQQAVVRRRELILQLPASGAAS